MARHAFKSLLPSLSTRLGTLVPPTRQHSRMGFVVMIAVVLLVGGVAAVVMPRIALNTQAARQSLVARLTAITGQPVSISGAIAFSFLPRTQLVVDRVRIGDANSTSIDRIVADLSLADALFGTAKIFRMVLVRPEYRGNKPTPGTGVVLPVSNLPAPDPAHGPLTRIRPLMRSFLERFQGLEMLEIRDGVWRPDPGSDRYGFSNANLTVTQSGAGAAMNVDGSFIWNGQPTDVGAVIDAPERLVADGSSDLDLKIASPALDTHFTGRVSLSRDNTIGGRLQLSVPSLGRSLEWLGNPKGRIPDVGQVSVDGTLLLAGYDAAMSDLDVTVAGSVGRGAIEASFGSGKPTVGGTLAFPSLDLTPLARAVAPLPNDPYDFDRPIDLAFADQVYLDLRLSAIRASLGKVALADMAAVVSLSDGALKVDIGDATLFGGRGRAKLVLDGRPDRVTASGDMTLYGVDTAQLLTAMNIDAIRIGGRSNVTTTMKSPIRDWRSLARNIEVDTQVDASNGAIAGFDPGVFAGPGARPLSQGFSGNRVPFRSLKAELKLRGDKVRMSSLTLVNSGGTLVASGQFMPIGHQMAIDGEFEPAVVASGAVTGKAPQTIAFGLDGTWPDPSVTTLARPRPRP